MTKNDQKQLEEELTDDVAPNKVEVVTAEQFEKLQTEFQTLQMEFETVSNQFKRALADYHNLEKRVTEGRSELTAWAGAEVIKRILPVVDHFDKALLGASEEDQQSGWFKGVKMSVGQLHQILRDEGLEQIEADGQFDPALHEAVDTKEGKENQILEIVEKGWLLNGKIVRPARVVVGKKA